MTTSRVASGAQIRFKLDRTCSSPVATTLSRLPQGKWICTSSAVPSSSGGRSSIDACRNRTFGRPPFSGFLCIFSEIFSRGRGLGSMPMKNLFGFCRADWYTKRPSPVPMSTTTPSPVGRDELFELTFVELSIGSATNKLQHRFFSGFDLLQFQSSSFSLHVQSSSSEFKLQLVR